MGNTRTKIGVFGAGGVLLHTDAFDEFSIDVLKKTINDHQINQIMLSSVADDSQITAYLAQQTHLNTVILTHETPLPIDNEYDTPQTLGKDRLAAIAGANYLYPRDMALVIDAGTCIKFDFIDYYARYEGGSISPGLAMRLKALHTFTQKLPFIEWESVYNTSLGEPSLIGKNTQNAILSGVINGTIAECDGIIEKYFFVYHSLTVLITGGDAPFLATKLKERPLLVPNLLLYGLYHIFNHQLSANR